jgi:hypothetical protein
MGENSFAYVTFTVWQKSFHGYTRIIAAPGCLSLKINGGGREKLLLILTLTSKNHNFSICFPIVAGNEIKSKR